MPVDYKNPTDNDILWMEAISNAQAAAMSRPDTPHFEGMMVFTRFLDGFTEPTSWDEGNRQLAALINDGPDRDAFRARSIELSKEAVLWLRDAIDARYANDAELGTPTDAETRDFIEMQYGKQIATFTKPDFFETEVVPIAKSFYEDRAKYSPEAFAMSAALGLPLSVAQQVVDNDGVVAIESGVDEMVSDGDKDFSFES